MRGPASTSTSSNACKIGGTYEPCEGTARLHAVLTGADLPNYLVGRSMRDMPILARDRVRFVGEKVVAVARTIQRRRRADNSDRTVADRG